MNLQKEAWSVHFAISAWLSTGTELLNTISPCMTLFASNASFSFGLHLVILAVYFNDLPRVYLYSMQHSAQIKQYA